MGNTLAQLIAVAAGSLAERAIRETYPAQKADIAGNLQQSSSYFGVFGRRRLRGIYGSSAEKCASGRAACLCLPCVCSLLVKWRSLELYSFCVEIASHFAKDRIWRNYGD